MFAHALVNIFYTYIAWHDYCEWFVVLLQYCMVCCMRCTLQVIQNLTLHVHLLQNLMILNQWIGLVAVKICKPCKWFQQGNEAV